MEKIEGDRKEKIEVVLPCLNEPYLPKILEELKKYKVNVKTEKGLSYATWKGIQEAKSEIIVVLDADGSHPTTEISKMIKCLNENVWFVIGSRYCRGGYNHDPFLRKITSLFYCLLARIKISRKIRDPMSGFWVGYKKYFDFKPSGGYKFGLQLIRKYESHIVEFPIIFEKRRMGKTHITPKQAINDLFSILKG